MAWKRFEDWTNLLLGAYLFFVPAMGLTGGAATTTYLVAASIVLVSFWALAVPSSKAAQWCNILLGAGFFFAPFFLGFTGVVAAAWSAYLVGALVALLAAVALSKTDMATFQRQP